MTVLLLLLLSTDPSPELLQLVQEARVSARQIQEHGGIPAELDVVADQLVKAGAKARPLLMPMLTDKSPGVRNFAGYVLRQVLWLTASDLPVLMTAHTNGNGWIAPAIARIGTPEALTFLAHDFVLHPQASTQLTFALSRFGAPAAIELAASLRSSTPLADPSGFFGGACQVVHDVTLTRALEDALLAVAKERKFALTNRVVAVQLLGCGKGVSAQAKQELDTLIASAPEIAAEERAASVRIELGTSAGIKDVISRLDEEPRLIGALANAGQSANEAEGAVLRFTRHADPGVRLAAAQALGAIGGLASVGPLVGLLKDETDWRMPCAAARSLAQLKASTAADGLADATHWYPPTQTCIRAAAKALRAATSPEKQWNAWEVPDGAAWRVVGGAPASALEPRVLSPEELAKRTVPMEIVGIGVDGKHVSHTREVPSAGLKYRSGELLGADVGEWGGVLVYVEKGVETKLLDQNVVRIHELGDSVLVTAGLSHLGFDEGAVYRIGRDAKGAPSVTLWRVLPGEPRESFVTRAGDLFVSCSGGDVLLTSAGTFSMAAAPEGP